MTLEITVKHSGNGFEVDLDELRRYGQYFIDTDRNLIIQADVYSHGTEDSRYVTATVVGTDYRFRPVDIDTEAVKQALQDELTITVTEDDAERIAAYYQQAGVEVVDRWAEEFTGRRVLSKATDDLLTTDIEEPLRGWEHEFKTIINRERTATDRSAREITRVMLNIVQDASPGDREYSARIELVNQS